jgi:hypothetical protein
MGVIFTLDPNIVATMNSAISDLLLYLGKDCRIAYAPKIIPCANCLRDPIGNKSKNIYLHGGPVPFPQGSICPICDGAGGTSAAEVTEILHLIVNWNPKVWNNTKVDNLRLSGDVLHIKGHIVDMPKIKRMDYLVPHIQIEAYSRMKFRLASDVISPGNIVQGQYFSCLLSRVQ